MHFLTLLFRSLSLVARREGAGPPNGAGPRAHGRYLDSHFRSRLNPIQQEALESKKRHGFQLIQLAACATSKRVL
jgi:hypothetical protein